MARETQESPIYWDQHATKWNLTLIFSVVVAVLGMFMQAILLIILGLGMAGYSWLTTPRQFLLYRDSMVIVYGMPRTRVISYAEISHVELLALPLGERLRIRMITGSRLMLMMRDPGAFRAHLEDALARYHGEQSGTAYIDSSVLDRGMDGDYDQFEPADEFDSQFDGTDADVEGVVDAGDDERYDESYQDSPPSGSYTEADQSAQADAEVYTGRVEQASSNSGSYTETPEPDFSGEGQSSYNADVELDTSIGDEEPPERPRSPY